MSYDSKAPQNRLLPKYCVVGKENKNIIELLLSKLKMQSVKKNMAQPKSPMSRENRK